MLSIIEFNVRSLHRNINAIYQYINCSVNRVSRVYDTELTPGTIASSHSFDQDFLFV